MADFDLTQTDAQVQSILNDAQNAQGAGAQTTLTTDYIMLKDTSGNYHKILKDSFTEACRNVLAGLLVNNDKGTTISQIPAIASGDFGSVTPANLASVLGGQITSLTNSTADSLVIGRMFGGGIIIQRTNNDGAISAINLKGPSEDYGSIWVTQNGNLKYLNKKTSKESEWNFGCSTLAELKAALANV